MKKKIQPVSLSLRFPISLLLATEYSIFFFISHYLHRFPFFQVEGWCISNAAAGHQHYAGMNSPSSLLPPLPLHSALCLLPELFAQLFPLWPHLSQMSGTAYPLNLCVSAPECVCVHIPGILSLPPWWPSKDTPWPREPHTHADTQNVTKLRNCTHGPNT